MKSILKCSLLFIIFWKPVLASSQITISPKISTNLNHYYWNNKNIVSIEDPQSWTWGIGVVSRLRFNKKYFGQFAFNFYPFGIEFSDEIISSLPPDIIATTSTDIFDIKIGIDYQLYPKTLIGLGIEMEQYINSKRILNIGTGDINYLNQKYFGAEFGIAQKIGRIELSAEIFIGLQEGGSVSSLPITTNGELVFFSHKKLQLGLAIPITL